MESPNKRLIQAWLDLQCTMVQGALRGAVMVGDGRTGSSDPIAIWPPRTMLSAPMISVAKQALTGQRQVIEALAVAAGSDIAHGSDIIATPLIVEQRTIGVVVLEMSARMKPRQDAALQVMSWGGTWLEAVIDHLNAGPNLRLSIVIETIAEAVKHEAFGAAAGSVAAALGRLLGCARVSIGFSERDDFKIEAISNTARFEQRTNLVRSVAAAMIEAVDQDQNLSLFIGAPETNLLIRAHQRHQAEFGSREIHTLPFSSGGELVGAITLERTDEQALSREDIALADTVVSIVGPILYTKRAAQLPLLTRLSRSLGDELHRFVEPGHLSFKAGISMLACCCLLLFIVKIDHTINADALLKGQVQRAVIAPYDGYIAQAPVRAGDIVAAGAPMGSLDDRELKLERAKLASEQAQLLKERNDALARHERAEVSILNARLDQAKAELDRVEEQLSRATIVVPIAGIVVSGDLSQSLGAPVKRGDLLFEVAPLNKYRIVLDVDERDIGFVQTDMRGQLSLASLPHTRYPFTIERIVPTSTAENGRNFFSVEARIDEKSFDLKPGMAGVGKIEVGRRSVIWVWTHHLSDRLRLMFWKWFG